MKNILLILCVILALGAAPILADKIYSENKKGNALYKRGDYEGALKLYDDALLESPDNEKLKMNRAAAHYQLDKLDTAYETLTQAQSIKDKHARADLFYNLGNTCFRQAEERARAGGQDASEKYKEALNNYIKALDLRHSDRDAKWNVQVTQQRIKQQQQQQQQQQQNQQNQTSEYAKRMKALADEAVAKRQYLNALNIMNEALQKDKTVMAYQDYIQRLKDINGIKK